MVSNKKLGLILNVIITIMLLIMVCLFVIYLFSFETHEDYDISKNTVLNIKTGNVKVKYQKLADVKYILPHSMTITSENEKLTLIGFKSDMKTNYDLLKSVIMSLVSKDNYIAKLLSDDINSYYCEKLNENGVLLKWNYPIPIEVLSFMSLKSTQIDNIYEGIIINKIYIYISDDGIEGFIFDLDDNVYIFREKYENASVNPLSSVISKFRTDGMINVNFAYEIKAVDSKYKGFCDDELISNNVKVANINCEYYSAENIQLNKNMFEELGLNLAKASIYTESDGSVIYMQEGKRINISSKGEIEYISDINNGRRLSEMIGISSNVEFFDYLGACLEFINKCGFDFGNGDVILSGVKVAGNKVYIDFGLSYDNNVIFDKYTNSYSFLFEGETLVHFECNPIIITKRSDYKKLNQYSSISYSMNSNNVKMIVGYKMIEDNVFNPSWYTISYGKEV